MKLTETTTQAEYAAYLTEASRTGNRAIAAHAAKVQNLTPDQWVAHRAKLLGIGERATTTGTTARLAAETFRRQK